VGQVEAHAELGLEPFEHLHEVPPWGVEGKPAQVALVEVPVGHAHRLAAVTEHDLQRAGVIVGVQQ